MSKSKMTKEVCLQKIERLDGRVKLYNNQNYYYKSQKCLLKIIKLTKGQEDDELRIIYRHAIKDIGHLLCANLKHPQKAIPYLNEAMDLFKQTEVGENKSFLSPIYLDLHYCYFQLKDHDQLIYYGQLVIEDPDISQEKKCQILATLGRFHFVKYLTDGRMGWLIRGLGYSTSALEMFESLKQTGTLEYAYCLFDMAEFYYRLEDIELSLKILEELVEISLVLPLPPDLLFHIYKNMIEIFTLKGYKETALYYKRRVDKMGLNV